MHDNYYYIEVVNEKRIEEKLDFKISKKRIFEIKSGKEIFYQDNFKEFYNKYEKELHSFDYKDLKKIYDETGIRVVHFIDNIDKEQEDSKKVPLLSSNLYSIDYTDYENNDNSYYSCNEELIKKRDKLYQYRQEHNLYEDEYTKSDYFDEFGIDLIIRTIPNILGKDKNGIYISNNNKKDYVYIINMHLPKLS